MNWKGYERKVSLLNLRHYPVASLHELKKNAKASGWKTVSGLRFELGVHGIRRCANTFEFLSYSFILLNVKGCYQLDRDVRYHFTGVTKRKHG